jgi:hypothetical protein
MPGGEERIRERAYFICEHGGQSEERAIEELEGVEIAGDGAGMPLTEKQTDESFDVGRSPIRRPSGAHVSPLLLARPALPRPGVYTREGRFHGYLSCV